MAFSIGLVGLPSAGKSTVFNALMQKHQAEVAEFNFTTINPNIGIIEVPDPRLDKIAQLCPLKKVIYSNLKLFDIAGLIRGAHRGSGLGNQFLSEINRVDLIVSVIRFFEGNNVPHPENNLHPGNDTKTILSELMLKDWETIDRARVRWQTEQKTSSQARERISLINKIQKSLENEKVPCMTPAEKKMIKHVPILTLKPIVWVANHSNAQGLEIEDLIKKFCPQIPLSDWVTLDALSETQLIGFDDQEKNEFCYALGIKPQCLEELLAMCFEKLNLINFFTIGENEVRAWQVKKGTKARTASRQIHQDFFKKFVRAKVISWQEFLKCQGIAQAKTKGMIKIEGEKYIVKDGDIIEFVISR